MNVDLQALLRQQVKQIYIKVSSANNVAIILDKLSKVKFFTNTKGWISRNSFHSSRGTMKYLVLNLESKEIAFNRDPPTELLLKTKLFVNEHKDFVNIGPKLKLKLG